MRLLACHILLGSLVILSMNRSSSQYKNTTDAPLKSIDEITTQQDIPMTSSLCQDACVNNTTIQQATTEPTTQYALKVLAYVYNVLLMLLGIPGNILAFVVLMRVNCRNMPGSLFLRIMTFSDIFVIFFTQLLGIWLVNRLGMTIPNLTVVLCKLLPPCLTFFSDLSKVSLLAFSFERFLCICFPLKMRAFISHKSRIIFLVTLVTVQLLFLTNDMITFQILVKTDEIKCEPLGWPLLVNVRYLIAMVFGMVPGIAMLIFNIAIIVVLLRQRIQIRGRKSSGTKNNVGGISALLLTVTFAYIILTTPMNIIRLFWISDPSRQDIKGGMLIGVYVLATNHAINIILYLASGKVFRDEFKALILQCFQVAKLRKASEEDSSTRERSSGCA